MCKILILFTFCIRLFVITCESAVKMQVGFLYEQQPCAFAYINSYIMLEETESESETNALPLTKAKEIFWKRGASSIMGI